MCLSVPRSARLTIADSVVIVADDNRKPQAKNTALRRKSCVFDCRAAFFAISFLRREMRDGPRLSG